MMLKPENGVFEAKPSSPFSGFAFNQLSEPLIFPNYGAEPETHAGSSQKSISVLHLPSVFGLYIIGIQSEKHGFYSS